MNKRLLATTLGCACILGTGATIASHYMGRGTNPPATAEAAPPLFLQSAQEFEPTADWPSATPVVFNREMIALLTMGAMTAMAADVREQDARPPRRMTRQERRRLQREEWERLRAERAYARDQRLSPRDAQAYARDERGTYRRDYRADSDTVDVYVRDRRGRTIRVQRVEREPAYQPRPMPNPFRTFGPFGNW